MIEQDRPRPLARVLAADHRPASNLPGQLAGATWTFLLPTLGIGSVAVVGTATDAARRSLDELIGPAAGGNPSLVWSTDPADDVATSSTLDGDADLAVHEHPVGARSGHTPDVAQARWMVWPAQGEIVAAVRSGDGAAADALRSRGLLSRAAAASQREITVTDRRTTTSDDPREPSDSRIPSYIVEMAADAGVAIAGWRAAFAAPGRYRTQKVLFLLWPPDAEEPSLVVKATRDPLAVPRLDNERDGLERLAALGVVTDGRTPRVAFAGRAGGRVFVGEEALPGRSLRATGPYRLGDPPIRDAMDWFTELAAASRRTIPTAALADALDRLVDLWAGSTEPDDGLLASLRSDVRRVATSGEEVPVVFQHGDPGTWNALLRPDGGVAFLDWENFEPGGIPLWDLFYLVRSVVADGRAGPLRRIVDRATGGRRVAIARRYRAVREHDPVVRDAVTRYCQTIGLEPELVGPLERLGWAYQALKEATRLPLGRGAYGASQAMLRSMRGGGWEEAT